MLSRLLKTTIVAAACALIFSATVALAGIGTPVLFGAGSGGAVSSYTFTTSANLPAGTLAVAVVQSSCNAAVAVSSVSDGTNSYVKATGAASTYDDIEIWYKANAKAVSSGATVTVMLSGTCSSGATTTIMSYAAGVALISPVDGFGALVNASASSAAATTSALAQPNEVAIGGSFIVANATETQSSGFSNIDRVYNSALVTVVSDQSLLSSAAALTYQPTWNTTNRVGSVVVTFKNLVIGPLLVVGPLGH